MYPGVGTFVLIRLAQTFYERIKLGANGRPELVASATEFILEGLHLSRRLNRDQLEDGFRYRS